MEEAAPGTLAAETARVVRHFQRHTSEQRARLAASRTLGPQQQRATGEHFYTHPAVPGMAFSTRGAAARAAVRAAGDG